MLLKLLLLLLVAALVYCALYKEVGSEGYASEATKQQAENVFFLQSGCAVNADCADRVDHCNLPDGRAGTCQLNATCCPLTVQNYDQEEWKDRSYPYCSFPMTSGGCNRYCQCTVKKHGGTVPECTKECEAKFAY